MTPRRAALAATLTLLLSVGGVAFATPAAACACGGVAAPPGSEVTVGEEHAIVAWDGRVERIDLLLGLLTEATETGIVLPTPSPATVSAGDRGDFDLLDEARIPELVQVPDWWGVDDGADGGAGAPPDVLDAVTIGPVEALTLAASDAAGLERWLADNGYGIAPEVADLLADYVAAGWYFVALKLVGDAPLDGALNPIRVEFAADAPIYPLALSRAATTPQTVRLYLLGEHRQRVAWSTDPDAEPPVAVTVYAGPLAGTPAAAMGEYLTVVELFIARPSVQIEGDLVITRAPTDDEVGTEIRVSTPVTVGGIPLGWVLVGLAVLGVAGVTVALAVVVRLRSA